MDSAAISAHRAAGPGAAIRSRAWLAVAVWAAVIFLTSTESFSRRHTRDWFEPVATAVWPSASRESRRALHRTARNLAHPAEFFVLTLLLVRAFRTGTGGPVAEIALRSLVVAVVYAFADEAHQAFVAGRSASIRDCAADALGAALAALSSTIQRRHS